MVAFTRRHRSRRALDLTPLIDVVFQLLVFFLLSSVFLDPAIPLQLPEANTAVVPEKPDRLVISVDPDGTVFVGDRQVADEALEEAVREGARGRDGVAVRGDVSARYGAFLRVVDACRAAGVHDLTLITGEAEKG